MRLWLNRTGEVSLREQLTTQISWAFCAANWRRASVCPARANWRGGSASMPTRPAPLTGTGKRGVAGVPAWQRRLRAVHASRRPARRRGSHRIRRRFVDRRADGQGAQAGAPPSLVHARLRQWEQMEPPARWLVIEPDAELRRIVIAEIEPALALPVSGCAPDDCGGAGVLDGAMAVVLPSKAAAVRKLLPAGVELTVLQVHPVAPELQAHLSGTFPNMPATSLALLPGGRSFSAWRKPC